MQKADSIQFLWPLAAENFPLLHTISEIKSASTLIGALLRVISFSIISRKEGGENIFFILSAHAGEGVHKFDADIREAVYELDGKVFPVVHKLPFSDVIREGIYRFYLQIREGRNHLDFQVREGVHYPYPSGKAYVFEISVPVDGTGSVHSTSCQKEQEKGENTAYFFIRSLLF